MKIGVSGANGHLGRAVVSDLLQRSDGHAVVAITRTPETVSGHRFSAPAPRPGRKRETTDLGELRVESFGKARHSRRQCGTPFPPFAFLGSKFP